MTKKNRKQIEIVRQDPQAAAGRPAALPKKPADSVDDVAGWLEDVVPLAIGLLTIVLARAVQPGIRDLFQLPKQLYMATGSVVLVGLVGALAAMGRPMRFRVSPMVWSGVAFMAAMLLSLLIAPKHTGDVLSIFARYDAHRWLAAAAVFWVTLVGVRRPRHIFYLLGGMALGGLTVSLIGIGEQHNIQDLLPPPDQRWNIISKPGSTFGNRNMAAQVVVTMLPAVYVGLAIALRNFVHDRIGRATAWMVWLLVTLLLLAYYIMLTVTRSAWLGALLGLAGAATVWGIGVWLARRDLRAAAVVVDSDEAQPVAASVPAAVGLFGGRARRLMVPLAALVVVGGGIGFAADRLRPAEQIEAGDTKLKQSVPELLKSFTEFGSNHYRWRFGMLASSWEAIKAEPLGGGAGNWRVIYPKYLVQREKNEMFTIAKQPIRAHNDILQIGVEYGWHGLLAFFALLASAVWMTVQVVRRAAAPRQPAGLGIEPAGAAVLGFAAMGSLMGILAILGDAQASFPLQLPVPTFLFALHLGIIAAADAMLTPRSEDVRGAQRQWPSWLSSATMAAAVVAMIFLQGFGSYQGLHERWMIAEQGFTDARNLQKSGRGGQALIEIRKAIAENPDDFQNHFIEALCLNSLGQTRKAIDSLYSSLALYPNLLNAWVNVAMFSARIGDTQRMNEAIDKALALKPDELVALNVRLGQQNGAGAHKQALDAVLAQHKGYEAYRAGDNWPKDDGGQLIGAYRQTLNHGVTAARKLDQSAALATLLETVDDLGIPNDGRGEASKQSEKRDRAGEIAAARMRLKQYDKALPWARLAAELARAEYPQLKRQYALALAWTGDIDGAAHEAKVALRIDKAGKTKLVEGLREVKAAGKADVQRLDALIQQIDGGR